MKVRLQTISQLHDLSYRVVLEEVPSGNTRSFVFSVEDGHITTVNAPDDLFAYFNKDGGRAAALSAAVMACYRARILDTEH